MALKSFNPYTASRRFVTMLDKSEITKQTPEKSLSSRRSARRTQRARRDYHLASAAAAQEAVPHHRFRREKKGHSAQVAAIEYDPNRSARLALLHYADARSATSCIQLG